MREVGTAVLKNKLSSYLGEVRKGSRFLVTDHGVPVAKLIPVTAETSEDTFDENLVAMEACGLITRPKKQGKFTRHKKIKIPDGLSASQIISEMREEREQAILSGLKRPH